MKKILFLFLFLIMISPVIVNAEKIDSNINQEETTINDNTTDDSNKTYDNYLKSLEIEGYKIDFNKHQSIYKIEVAKEVRELKIEAIPESNNAKVEIVGADNIDENNKIIINVTAENGEVKKYIININRIKDEKKDNSFLFEITEDQKKMGIIFSSIVLGLGIIIFIIIRIRDRKIEKGINKW